MESNTTNRTARSVINKVRKGDITFDAFFQRKAGQWNNLQKGLLIDTILRRYPIPAIYATRQPDKTLSVIDGCQRLSTIKAFIDGEFRLPKSLGQVIYAENVYEIGGKSYKALPEELQDVINDCSITVCAIEDASPDEIIELFNRLNNGTPLTQAQRNKALMGHRMTQMVAEIAAKPVFDKFLSPTQAKRDEGQMLVVQSLMLLSQDEVGSFRGKQIRDFISDYTQEFDEDTINRLSEVFDLLAEILPEESYPALKKSAIPPIIKVLSDIADDEEKVSRFANGLTQFLGAPNEYPEYAQHIQSQTTDRGHIEGRVNFFQNMVA